MSEKPRPIHKDTARNVATSIAFLIKALGFLPKSMISFYRAIVRGNREFYKKYGWSKEGNQFRGNKKS